MAENPGTETSDDYAAGPAGPAGVATEVAQPQSQSPSNTARETAPASVVSVPATIASAAPRPDSVVPPPQPATVPQAVLDSLRNKLRLASFFAEREEYVDAFEQLRLVRTRLDALRVDFPTAASLRTIRQQHADAQTSITSYCQAARQVALGRGDNPPLCR